MLFRSIVVDQTFELAARLRNERIGLSIRRRLLLAILGNFTHNELEHGLYSRFDALHIDVIIGSIDDEEFD